MTRRTLILPFVVFCGSAAFAQKKPVTLEALAARPPEAPPGPVRWALDGSRFLYQQGEALWLYDLASKSRKQLVSMRALADAATKFPEPEVFEWQNRNVREQSIQWASSGIELLLVTGGDLFLFRLAAGGWTQITATPEREHDPKLSPDGRRISFRRDRDLYVLEISSRKVTRLTHDGSATLWNAQLDWVYPEELELQTAHWWSPDSKRIAYLQFDVSREPVHPHADLLPSQAKFEPQRFPKAGDPNPDVRLGVVSADGGPTRWMDLGETRDTLLARVHWSPDSRSLLVQRLNRIQNRLDLLRVSADSGRTQPVLREEDPFWINLRDHLRFLKDGNEFLWPSERDGYCHLYRYSIDGKQLAQLTRGDWVVTDVAGVDERSGQVYYVSTEAGPLERHLYSVKLDGGERRRITESAGTHTISMGPTCDYFLDTYSSLKEPPRRVIRKADGAQHDVFSEQNRRIIEEYDLPPREIVEVKTSDGALLYAQLTRPAGFQPGKKYPAIVMVYGGPHAQSVRNAWQSMSWEHVLAHRGFVIWELDNRGTYNRGHKWESVIQRNFGARELEDQKEGVRHLIALGFVDSARIGLYGWSYGGFMTLNSLLNAPEVFKAGVAGAPVTDWRNYDTIYTERYMGLPSDNADGYRRSSPVHYASKLTGKLLLVHNLGDDNVLFQHTLQMVDALQRAGKQFEMMIYPQKSHGVSGPARRHMLKMMTEFFERSL